jgi:hypothetical protein
MKKRDRIMRDMEKIAKEVEEDFKVAWLAEEDQRRNNIITERDRGIIFTI